MNDIIRRLAEAGIRLKAYREGEHRTACPRCNKARDTALAVRIDDIGATWLCHRCGWTGSANERESNQHRPAQRIRSAEDSRKAEADHRFIKAVLRAAVPIEGTPAADYLLSRGCALPPAYDALLFHRGLRHPTGIIVPALVATLTDLTDAARVTGLHLIALNADGIGKRAIAPRKWTRGVKQGSVVRLVDDAEVTYALGLCEGIETGLAIIKSGWRPIWSALDAGNLEALPILWPLNVTIFADADQRGLSAAQKLAGRYSDAELGAVIVPPRSGDWCEYAA